MSRAMFRGTCRSCGHELVEFGLARFSTLVLRCPGRAAWCGTSVHLHLDPELTEAVLT